MDKSMICPRCLKNLRRSILHTCTPTDFVRDLEQQLAECQQRVDARDKLVVHMQTERNQWNIRKAELCAACQMALNTLVVEGMKYTDDNPVDGPPESIVESIAKLREVLK